MRQHFSFAMFAMSLRSGEIFWGNLGAPSRCDRCISQLGVFDIRVKQARCHGGGGGAGWSDFFSFSFLF